MLQTSVAFFIFNRPQLAGRVFAEIAAARPTRLFVVADGPRSEAERTRCEEARRLISEIDWPCEISTNFADTNLGCKRRVSSGLDWVFSQCEEAIILEDDCLPHPTFFRYCAEMLDRYRDDGRVMMISGDNFQFGRQRTRYSYYFSRYSHVWGWASWRRAWRHYDVDIRLWPILRETSWLADVLGDVDAAACWRGAFDRVYGGDVDTWDYQWMLACLTRHGFSILPSVNLISNLGHGPDATHGKGGTSRPTNLPSAGMVFPLQHPPDLIWNREADQFTFEHVLLDRRKRMRLKWRRIRRRLHEVIPVMLSKGRSKLGLEPR